MPRKDEEVNRVILIGNLTKDPELRTTAQDISVCTFRIAVTRPFKRDETDFLSIVTWRRVAENCAKYLAKGSKVGVVGYIQIREYEANDGSKRYVTEIVADDVEFLTPKSEGSGTPNAFDQQEDFEPLDDESLPF